MSALSQSTRSQEDKLVEILLEYMSNNSAKRKKYLYEMSEEELKDMIHHESKEAVRKILAH